MSFKNVRFPTDISIGASGGPEFATDVIVVQNGTEKRNSLWSVPLYTFECAHGVKTQSMLNELIAFFKLMKGKLHSFRFKNWAEYTIDASNCSFSNNGILNGGSTYQIHRKTRFQSEEYDYHKITKIVDGTFKLYENGVEVPSAYYNLDINTGILEITTYYNEPIQNIANNTTGTVTSAFHNLTTGDKVVLKDVVGINVNDIIFTVTVVDINTFNLNYNTTSLGTYVSGGQWRKYISQANYTFECEFDFHVRFDVDRMAYNIDNYNIYSWNQITLKEIR